MFRKKNLKSRRSKVTMLFEENIQCPSFSSTPIFSWILCTKNPTVSPSNAFFIPCRYYSSFFFCLSTVFRCLAVINILNSVQPCDSRCVLWDAWKCGCLFKFPGVKCQSAEFLKDLCSRFSLIDLSPCFGSTQPSPSFPPALWDYLHSSDCLL